MQNIIGIVVSSLGLIILQLSIVFLVLGPLGLLAWFVCYGALSYHSYRLGCEAKNSLFNDRADQAKVINR